jgi:methanogenic corrinoid protein MtbC1
MTEFKEESEPFFELAKNYMDALLNVQRDAASRMILKAVDEGTGIKDIYIHVFESSQHEIGRLWQTNKITVAQEHFCTAATQMIMSQLYPYIFRTDKIGLRLVAACAAGEMHEIGVRMVADIFEMEGWDTYYLGANTPNESMIQTIIDLKPDIIAISASIHYNIVAVMDLIKLIRNTPDISNIKIMVGGRPFLLAPELWRKVGADGCPTNAIRALSLADELVSSQKQVEESNVR